MNREQIMVSVIMLTYNHAKYIRQALDSVLMQKVNFRYEIVIGDDCSKDETQEIIKEYIIKYQDIFVPTLRDINIGATKNAFDLLIRCNGKYIATLEGDDCWLDENKLQKQFDFLERTDYMAIYNDVLTIDENNKVHENYIYPSHQSEVYTLKDWEKWITPGQAGGSMMKNIYRGSDEDFSILHSAHSNMSDRTLALILATKGNIYCDKEVLSAYRYVTNSGTSFSALNQKGVYNSENYTYFLKIFEYYKSVTGKKLDSYELEKLLLYSSIQQFYQCKDIKNFRLVISTFLNLKNKTALLKLGVLKILRKTS